MHAPMKRLFCCRIHEKKSRWNALSDSAIVSLVKGCGASRVTSFIHGPWFRENRQTKMPHQLLFNDAHMNSENSLAKHPALGQRVRQS